MILQKHGWPEDEDAALEAEAASNGASRTTEPGWSPSDGLQRWPRERCPLRNPLKDEAPSMGQRSGCCRHERRGHRVFEYASAVTVRQSGGRPSRKGYKHSRKGRQYCVRRASTMETLRMACPCGGASSKTSRRIYTAPTLLNPLQGQLLEQPCVQEDFYNGRMLRTRMEACAACFSMAIKWITPRLIVAAPSPQSCARNSSRIRKVADEVPTKIPTRLTSK